MTKAFPLCLVAGLLAVLPVRADLVYGNLGPSGTDGLDTDNSTVTGTTWYALGFKTPTSGGMLYLQTIQLGLSVTSGSSGILMQLFSDAANQPTGAALVSINTTVTTVAPTLYNFALTTPLQLSNNSTYWVVTSDNDGGTPILWNWDAVNGWPTAQNGSGYSAPTPVILRSTNSGVNWADRSSLSYVSMNLIATGPAPIPEPGTWAAAALLVGAAGYVRWRRRAPLKS